MDVKDYDSGITYGASSIGIANTIADTLGTKASVSDLDNFKKEMSNTVDTITSEFNDFKELTSEQIEGINARSDENMKTIRQEVHTKSLELENHILRNEVEFRVMVAFFEKLLRSKFMRFLNFFGKWYTIAPSGVIIVHVEKTDTKYAITKENKITHADK